MKTYLKKQAKKSLSVMLALLMVLSCWVWIAPEGALEAEAAATEAEAGYYYVQVYGNYHDWSDAGEMDVNTWTVTYKEDNGTGAEKTTTLSYVKDPATGAIVNDIVIAAGWVPGFPTKVRHDFGKLDSFCGGNGFGVQPRKLYVGSVANTSTASGIEVASYGDQYSAVDGGYDIFSVDMDANAPYAAAFEAMSPETLTIPKIGTGIKDQTDPVKPAVYDQYGVRMTKAVPQFHISDQQNGQAIETSEEKGMWIVTNADGSSYVKIDENMQINYPVSNTETKKDYYLVAYNKVGDNEYTSSQQITFTYQTYTTNVKADGAISGLGALLDLSDNTKVNQWTHTGAYGTEKTPYPSGTASKEGYTFKGFWTKQQPAAGAASYNAYEADFATPVETAKFNEYKAAEGAEVITGNGYEIVKLNGNIYCDGGTQWNPEKPGVYGNIDYYGWWISQDLTVKFYDVDGSYITTMTVKYGMTGSDISWPDPTDSYENGAFSYNTFSGTWIGIDGEKVAENSYKFTHDLTLAPTYNTVNFTDKYNITFKNPNSGATIQGNSGEYLYREDIGSKVPTVAVPSSVATDLQYSYTFEGWSSVVPSNGKNFHVIREESDFDENGNVVGITTDWIVRGEATYYAVYRRHLKSYAVEFQYTDSTGASATQRVSVKYGDELKAPEGIPVQYAKDGMGYVLQGWSYVKSGSTLTFDYDKAIIFNSSNITIAGVNYDDGVDVQPIVIKAVYDQGTPTPYTVTFKFRNDDGALVTETVQVRHNEYITADTTAKLLASEKYDDGEALYTFEGTWKVTEGVGLGNSYETAALTGIKLTSHMTFEAVYGDPVPFYTVTYVDGAKTYSERVLAGANVPAWMIGEEEYVPAMEKNLQGQYVFQGWFDAKQADADYEETNGTKYTTESIVTGNLTLYPQFKFTAFTYVIRFMDYEGKVQLAAGEFEYGQNIEAVIASANVAAQGRPGDETYTYSFIGWDKPVSTICEGQDMTFIAQYKPVYRYYDAKWYNSKLENGNWVIDKSTKTEGDKVVETALLATTHHTYNSKLYNPSIDNLECTETAPEGQSYVFAGWYYTDANGYAQPYVRGMLITGAMEFYATYALTKNAYTVTTVVKGEETEYKVADGDKAAAVPTPDAGYVDAENHDEFVAWYTTENFAEGTEFNINEAVINGDITIYAKFSQSKHEKTNKELITAPTYYEKGKEAAWCSCDPAQTRTESVIDELEDNKIPTGTMYIGTQWKTGDAINDEAEPTIYVNDKTDIILTINDTGDVNELYNPSGIGKGIALIRGFISTDVYSPDNENVEMSEIVTIYQDDSEALNNTYNVVITLGDYKNPVGESILVDGGTYIAYFFVQDKAGNVLNRNVRSAKFIYDTEAPEFEIAGNSNAETATGTPTYCGTATVAEIEKDAILTVNGEVIHDRTSTAANGVSSYTITEAGNYLINVTDKAGNKASEKIVIADEHNIVTREVLSTCTEDGYKTEICSVCGFKKTETIYKATGHNITPVVFEATCTDNGYILHECDTCDYSQKVEVEVDENGAPVLNGNGEQILLYPALGHSYPTKEVPAEEGGEPTEEIVYTVITEATCVAKGKEISVCTVCNHTLTRETDIDEEAHNWGALKTLRPTCTAEGKTYKSCKLCYESVDVEILPATEHEETQWVVTVAATCGAAGVETEQCKKCKTYIGEYKAGWYAGTIDPAKLEKAVDKDGNFITQDGVDHIFYFCYELDENGQRIYEYSTRSIPATGRHILAVSEDPTKTFDATADKEGQITRYCKQCGQEWVEKVAKIEKYTVKFVGEDGTTAIKTIADVVSGTTITDKDITDPTKANSADGKYKYAFAGWVDATTDRAVTLPFDVTGNITLKATFTESTIIYTHIFKVPTKYAATLDNEADNYNVFATLMGAMGDVNKVPVAIPVFTDSNKEQDEALKKIYTFKFLGWSTTGTEGGIVEDFTVTDNATFYAVFEAIPVEYDVIFYNGTVPVWSTTVDGGETVTYANVNDKGEIIYPEKNFDSEYHYEFDKWYTDSGLKNEFKADTAITATTRLYAGFTKIEHSYDKTKGTVTQKQNCVLPELTEYTCECGHKTVEQTKAALGHTSGTPVQETVDGVSYSVVYCTVEGCKAEISRTKVSVQVVFKYDTGVRLATYNLNLGNDIEYNGEEPTKATDNQKTYKFIGWYVEGDDSKTVVNLEGLKASADVVYVAKFEASARTFRVTYVDKDNKTLQTTEGIAYGEEVPGFTGDTSTLGVPAYDTFEHYVFEKWSIAAGTTVEGDLLIQPVFKAVEHNIPEDATGVATDATCTQKGGLKYECADGCGYSYIDYDNGIPALGHNWNETSRIPADPENQKDGSIICTCTRCGETKTEAIPFDSNAIRVTVKDQNGNPIEHAEVRLLKDGVILMTQTTNDMGVVIFTVTEEYDAGKYNIYVVTTGETFEAEVNEDGTVENGNFESRPEEVPEDNSCKCTCHKGTFWGIIFRLFQKIIKIFTGKPTCCACPDSRI